MSLIKLSNEEWFLTFWEKIQYNKIMFLSSNIWLCLKYLMSACILHHHRFLRVSGMFSVFQMLKSGHICKIWISVPYIRLAGRKFPSSALSAYFHIWMMWPRDRRRWGPLVSPRSLQPVLSRPGCLLGDSLDRTLLLSHLPKDFGRTPLRETWKILQCFLVWDFPCPLSSCCQKERGDPRPWTVGRPLMSVGEWDHLPGTEDWRGDSFSSYWAYQLEASMELVLAWLFLPFTQRSRARWWAERGSTARDKRLFGPSSGSRPLRGLGVFPSRCPMRQPCVLLIDSNLCLSMCCINRHRGLVRTTHISGFQGGTGGKESSCQCRRCKRWGFGPWVRKIFWRKAWQPTPVFLPRESHGQRSLAGYSP